MASGGKGATLKFGGNVKGLVQALLRAVGSMNALSAAAVAAGAAVTAAISSSLSLVADLDKRARQVTALLIDGGETELAAIKRVAGDVASEFNVGNEAVLNALYEGISAGAAGIEDATEVARVAAMAQVAAGVDMAVSAKFYQQQSRIWGKNIEEIADITAATERTGSITTEQLVQNLGKVSTTAASAGVSAEELNAQIAVLTQAGILPTQAIEAMNAVYREALNNTSKLNKAVEMGLGKTMTALIADGWTVVDILAEMRRQLGDDFTQIFGQETGILAGLALTDNQEIFVDKMDSISNSQGELMNNYVRASEGVGHSMDAVKQGLEDLKTTVGEAFAPALIPVFKGLAKSLKDFAEDEEFTAALEDAAEAIGGALEGLVEQLPAMIDVVSSLAQTFDDLSPLIGGLSTVVGALADTIGGVVNVIGLAVDGVNEFVDMSTGLVEGVGDVVGSAVDFFGGLFGGGGGGEESEKVANPAFSMMAGQYQTAQSEWMEELRRQLEVEKRMLMHLEYQTGYQEAMADGIRTLPLSFSGQVNALQTAETAKGNEAIDKLAVELGLRTRLAQTGATTMGEGMLYQDLFGELREIAAGDYALREQERVGERLDQIAELLGVGNELGVEIAENTAPEGTRYSLLFADLAARPERSLSP